MKLKYFGFGRSLAVTYTEHAKRMTVTAMDVVYAMRVGGHAEPDEDGTLHYVNPYYVNYLLLIIVRLLLNVMLNIIIRDLVNLLRLRLPGGLENLLPLVIVLIRVLNGSPCSLLPPKKLLLS